MSRKIPKKEKKKKRFVAVIVLIKKLTGQKLNRVKLGGRAKLRMRERRKVRVTSRDREARWVYYTEKRYQSMYLMYLCRA